MKFSVITPTFNRAHTLPFVYKSLLAQTMQDFEWLIIDDGSSDLTRDLVSGWRASFPIHYFWKPNGGKHTAINYGVRRAKGFLTLIFDSDDQCTPNTLQVFQDSWDSIPDPDRFANVSCLCQDSAGRIIGEQYPKSPYDAFTFRDQLRMRSAERWGINRTDVMREFPFPEEVGGFVPEALVWNRISQKYAARFINIPLRIYEQAPDSLSGKVTQLTKMNSSATLTYYKELWRSSAPIFLRLKSAFHFLRVLSYGTQRGSRNIPTLM